MLKKTEQLLSNISSKAHFILVDELFVTALAEWGKENIVDETHSGYLL